MPMAIGQILNMVACGVIDLASATADKRHSTILAHLKNSLGRNGTEHVLSMTLFHGAREGEEMKSTFFLWRSVYRPKTKRWSDEKLPIEDRSYLASVDGTGKPTVEKFLSTTTATAASGTSRAAIHAFCRSLKSGEDPFSGGPPQMVGLWRIGPAQQFGYYWRRRFYVFGMECPDHTSRQGVYWFNDLFEHCDPKTGKRREESASHQESLSR